MRIFKKRYCNTHGFTLGETLLAVLIMLLAASIMVSGIPAARAAYEKVVLSSNAEVLLSTAVHEILCLNLVLYQLILSSLGFKSQCFCYLIVCYKKIDVIFRKHLSFMTVLL